MTPINVRKKEVEIEGSKLCYYEYCEEGFCFGYTEDGWNEVHLGLLFRTKKLLLLKQVHQNKIVDQSQYYNGIEADGIILNMRGDVGIVKTADCLPIFIYDGNIAGLIHAGWRGISLGIVEEIFFRIESILRLNAARFVLGVAIEQDCYEVQYDLAKIFWNKFPDQKKEIVREKNGRYYLGLKAAVKAILVSSGINLSQIMDIERCTFCDLKLPSYRRQKDQAGRIYNFIYLI